MRLRYLIPAALLLLIGFAVWRYWGAIMYGALAFGAFRMWHTMYAPKYLRSRGKRGGSALHKWADTAALAAIAYRVGPRQAKKTDGIPQRVLIAASEAPTQVAADDPRWDDEDYPYTDKKYV